MTSGSRFRLNALCLIALIFGLAFSTLGTPAQAGLFGRCGGGLFGRRANASACSSGYTAQYQMSSPCGQATGYSYGYNQSTYGYAAPAQAPCAPCGQAAPPMPTYAPPAYPSTAPVVQSVPQVGIRLNCTGPNCRLTR